GGVVHRAVVYKKTVWVDDEKVGSGFGPVGMADDAGGVQQGGGWHGPGAAVIQVRPFRLHVAFLAGGGGNDLEPDHPFPGPYLLESLHLALVLALGEGTVVIMPFQNHELSLVIHKLMNFPA